MDYVTLVCGPPCGGKSTFVQKSLAPGDLVVCRDMLAQHLGSTSLHDHPKRFAAATSAAYDAELRNIRQTPHGRAWVIRSAPGVEEREEIAAACEAIAVIILMPDIDETIRRAARDNRSRETFAAIRDWYEEYEPDSYSFVVNV